MSPDPKDETSIGGILIKMSAIKDEDLKKALEIQERSSMDVMLGALLIAGNICTREQVDMALAAQEGLRSGKSPEAAMAIADIAHYRKKKTNTLKRGLFERVKAATGDAYPAVTAKAEPNG